MGRVIDEYVDPAQFAHGRLNNAAAVARLLYVASDQHSLPACLLHKSLGLLGIIIVIQIRNEHAGALARIRYGDRAANSAVAAGDNRLFSGETARAAV